MPFLTTIPRRVLSTMLALAAMVAWVGGHASPPLLPGADPHAMLVDGAVWIFPTWSDTPRGPKFFGFSSTNLTDWKRHGPLLDLSEIPWVAEDKQPWHGPWAPCVLRRGSRWYFYYSVGPQNPTPSRLGVAVADQPGGPYKDSGRPLLTGGNGFEAIDPMVFEDPKTGVTYLYAGGSAGAKLRVFELASDLVSFAREVPVDTPPKFTEGAFMHVREGRYYLSYSHGGWQHASYSVHYATAPTPIGPWTYEGPILTSDATRKGPGHHSFLHFPGTDDWRIVYHRWENQTGNGPYKGSRQICIDRVEYGADGRILPVVMSEMPPSPPPPTPSAKAAGNRTCYPASPFVVDVTQAPYGAVGDGITDDTEALQRALNENVGRNRALYFPKGTYLVRRTLTWPKEWKGRNNWGFTFLRGQHRDQATIRLADGTFTNAAKPQAIMWCGGFGSADWFHNYVEHLTFDVGNGNPGAVALQFYSNNSGAVRDCRFVAGEGSGAVGLDLSHRDMNGPLLVRRCEVIGFRRGVAAAHSVNSQTFEHLVLRGQREFGLDNAGQTISVRGLTSENSVPAVRSYGTFTLVEARLTGRGSASNAPAIINYNGGRMLLRDVATSGYRRALGDVATPDFAAAFRIEGPGKDGSLGPVIPEYASHPSTSPFASKGGSLRLPVRETPEPVLDPLEQWATVDDFGADPTGQRDSSAAVQKAMDSGATTVFLPGSYNLRETVVISGRVRRVVGLGGTINYGKGLRPDFRLLDGDASPFHLEHFSNIHGGIEVDTKRTLVVRSVSDCRLEFTARAAGGDVFAEDFVTHGLSLKGQNFWARQLNIENEGTHLSNDAGTLWVLGYKTERGGTVLHAHGGGRSEILGGFSYTTTAGRLAPMFVNQDSSVFAFFSEVCYNGDPFAIVVRESRGGEVREVGRGRGNALPYVGR